MVKHKFNLLIGRNYYLTAESIEKLILIFGMNSVIMAQV